MLTYRTYFVPTLLGSIFILMDFISDVAFIFHLHNHGRIILFSITLCIVMFSTIFINILAAIAIEELSEEMTSPDMEDFQLEFLWANRKLWRILWVAMGFLGLLPHALTGFSWILVKKGIKLETEESKIRLKILLGKGGGVAAVKEVQSVLETGAMIYIKFFYVFVLATLYTNNWPIILGLCFNIGSLFFGLRNDLVKVQKWKHLALIVAFVNLSLRMVILCVLANNTKPWYFFLPNASAMFIMFIWGLYLTFGGHIMPKKMEKTLRDSAPDSILDNLMSSISYSFFLVPVDWHTSVAILPFAVASIAVPCFAPIPLGTKIMMPLAGTLGQVPSMVWWKIFKIHTVYNS